ncbi:MAG: triose-phosphate isomerase [Hadesarchaea archaeon]|nr:MAG: triose-phosphate isomerase [Hadesarchaea archaeon]
MKTPIVIVNFKTYPQSVGERAVELAKTIAEVAKEKGISVAAAPQNLDLYRVASQVDIPVLAQHVDSITSGAHTGWLLAETVKATGAVGSLINHSEHQIQSEEIEQVVRRLRELELTSVVCAKNPEVCKKVAAFKPDMVAVEPPELIGTGRAVSKLKPEVVSDAVKMVREINPEVRVLCGAGITNGEDTRIALELGAEGVLLASSVVKATDPRAAMLDVAKGITLK